MSSQTSSDPPTQNQQQQNQSPPHPASTTPKLPSISASSALDLGIQLDPIQNNRSTSIDRGSGGLLGGQYGDMKRSVGQLNTGFESRTLSPTAHLSASSSSHHSPHSMHNNSPTAGAAVSGISNSGQTVTAPSSTSPHPDINIRLHPVDFSRTPSPSAFISMPVGDSGTRALSPFGIRTSPIQAETSVRSPSPIVLKTSPADQVGVDSLLLGAQILSQSNVASPLRSPAVLHRQSPIIMHQSFQTFDDQSALLRVDTSSNTTIVDSKVGEDPVSAASMLLSMRSAPPEDYYASFGFEEYAYDGHVSDDTLSVESGAHITKNSGRKSAKRKPKDDEDGGKAKRKHKSETVGKIKINGPSKRGGAQAYSSSSSSKQQQKQQPASTKAAAKQPRKSSHIQKRHRPGADDQEEQTYDEASAPKANNVHLLEYCDNLPPEFTIPKDLLRKTVLETRGIEYQAPRSPDDLYTPRFARGSGITREGICLMCPAIKWHKIKISAFWQHLHWVHGVNSATGHFMPEPNKARTTAKGLEGHCGSCDKWILMDGGADKWEASIAKISAGKGGNTGRPEWPNLWWKHIQKCQKH